MKSFGYTQRSVSKLVLIEIVLLSLIGTVIGVPLGIWLGDLFMQELLSMLQFDIVYTLNWRLPAIMAVIVGVLFPVLFSLFPIYHAGKTSILLTLKMASQSKESSRPLLIRAVVGLVLLCFVFIDHSVTYAAVLAGVILLFPLLLAGLSRIIKPVLNFLFIMREFGCQKPLSTNQSKCKYGRDTRHRNFGYFIARCGGGISSGRI